MWDFNGKKPYTCLDLWEFISMCCLAAALLSHPSPGALPGSPAVTTGLQQFPLALAVTTRSNPTPTHRVLPCHLPVVALDVLLGLCSGGGQTTYPFWDLPLLLSGYLSLDRFFHPVDCEAAGMLGATLAKGRWEAGMRGGCWAGEGTTCTSWLKVSPKLWPHCEYFCLKHLLV